MPIEKRPIDLRRLIEDADRLIRPTLPASITLDIENDSPSPLWVEADPSQIHQVLLNLAINARDAMPAGGRLHMTVRRGQTADGEECQPGDMVEIVVTDTGIGIAAESLGKIFEPFFTTKPRERNSGLGLSIVQSIVEEHGGTSRRWSRRRARAPPSPSRFRRPSPAPLTQEPETSPSPCREATANSFFWPRATRTSAASSP